MPAYTIPIPKNVKFEIVKPAGKFAHENFIEAYYAIDFKVPEGTPVLAARAGRIWMVKDNSQKYGLDARAEDANFVAIDHGDGTFAEYLHLGCKQVFVKVSQEVKQGEVIALTGTSGVMDVPHLHLNVFKMINKKPRSIPIEFE